MANRRVRTHANPLSYPDPIPREEWVSRIGKKRPLRVDMGCGKGDFLLSCAQSFPKVNFVGVEVRKPIVEMVNEKIAADGLPNAACICGNASISLRSLFLDGEVEELTINFPDPWLKPKHRKRRLITPATVDDLFTVLADGGVIYLLTDVKEIFDDFCTVLSTRFEQVPYRSREQKSYWQKYHQELGTVLFGACFVKR